MYFQRDPTHIVKFFEEAHIDPTRMRIYSSRRQPAMRLAEVIITGCQNERWWYKDFVGVECLVELRFDNYGRGEFLREATVVVLTNTRVLHGRGLHAEDFSIL